MEANSHPRWASRISFIFAASAAAIGLGNIWRFPYMTGQNGGAAFVLIYLACVIVLGIPLLIAEATLGRVGRRNPAAALAHLAEQSNRSKRWAWLGAMNILASFLILTYYVVIVGWVMDYTVRALFGQFAHITEAAAVADFKNLQSSHWQMLLTDTATIFASVIIIYLGVKKGLERAVLIMFPALLALMVLLLIYAMTTGSFMHSVSFLFKPDFSKLTSSTILLALGQAFFSLNIAMGVTMMFSAYLPKDTPLISSVIAITIADTGIALLAGLIIFPIVFANNLTPAVGPSLIFQTLPLAFGKMPFGTPIAILFFVMLFFAAFTSVIALLEPAVCWLMDTWNMSRHRAVIYTGVVLWILSLGAIGSFSSSEHFSLFGITFFKAVDYLTANLMLPIGGLLIAIFTGWFLSRKVVQNELPWKDSIWLTIWQIILRYLAPVAIVIILLGAIGIL